MSKKNKSRIMYGGYIHNEQKTKNKNKNKNTNNQSSRPIFFDVLDSIMKGLRFYYPSVFTLGGTPIVDNTYDKTLHNWRKISGQGFNSILTDGLNSTKYEIDQESFANYQLQCQIQDAAIEESLKNYEPTNDELFDLVFCGIDSQFLDELAEVEEILYT